MLLKWAVEGKRRSRRRDAIRLPHVGRSSICTKSSPRTPSDPTGSPRNSEDERTPLVPEPPKVAGIEQSRPSLPRLVSEERASILRDEKLLAASNPNPRQLSISMPPTPSSIRIKVPTPALTVENMALLSREFEVNPFDLLTFKERAEDDGSDSDASTNPDSATPEGDRTPLEPQREFARDPSSQITITLPNRRRDT